MTREVLQMKKLVSLLMALLLLVSAAALAETAAYD